MIDVGARRTVVAVVAEGRIQGVRTFSFGGERITEALAADLGISLEDAERVKLESGRAPADDEAAPDDVVASIGRALAPLASGLRQTFHAILAESGVAPERIALCGGTANLPGIDGWIGGKFEIPATRLAPLDEGIERSIAAGAAQQARMAVSLGLALRPFSGRRQDRLNLRSGEFAHRGGGVEQLRSRVRQLAVMGGVLLVLMAVQAYLGYSTYAGQARQIDQQLRQIYAKVFPSQPAVQPVKQFGDNLARMQQKAALLSGLGDGSLTALGILREVSQKIPTTVTDGFNAVDAMEAALKQVPAFRSIKKDQATKVAGEKIKFKFTIALTETKPGPGAPAGGPR